MLRHHLIFLIGMMHAPREMMAVPQFSAEGRIAYYHFCNLTWVPLVPETVVLLSLDFNYIQEVNATSFPYRERLKILSLGTQFASPVTLRRGAFWNVPNLIQLDLADNKMLVLDQGAFVGLVNLQNLLLYANGLDESILEGAYLRDLVSLQYLDLRFNLITRLRPHPLFYNMKFLDVLSLKLNPIKTICEGDLDSFRGKRFTLLDLNSNHLYTEHPVDWATCGNPLKNILIDVLDVGNNGWDVATTQQFCAAIQGTPLLSLKVSSGSIGLSFGFNNLQDPDNYTFAGLARSGLLELNISHSFIFSLNPYVFQYLADLKFLDLNSNNINQIQKEAFFGLQSLERLYLSDNLLGELLAYSFKGLHNLIYLDLQHNHIGVIQEGTFEHLPRLQEVYLRDNALKVIRSLPNLNYAFLGDNRLSSTGTNRITAINATNLDLEGNRLGNLGDLYELLRIPDVQFIFLRNNHFSYCYKYNDVANNSQLRYLDLGDNMLSLVWQRGLCLDVFKALSKLETLHLDNNYLSLLPEGIFSGLVSLNRLNLASNQLNYISHSAFPPSLRNLSLSFNQLFHPDPQLFTTLDYLNISYNHFYCNCHLNNLIVWLNQTNVTLAGSPDEMFCFGPPELAGVFLHKLNFDGCDEGENLESLQLSLFIFTCVVVTMFLVLAIGFTRFRGTCFVWYKTVTRAFMNELQEELDKKTYRYDAYLCYSSKDFEWVQNCLIKHLDSKYCDKNRFALCFEDRDFLPGEDHISNIRDAIWNCRKTICVVTKQFLKDGWCVEAFNFAQSRYFSDLKDVLIMVVAGSLSQYQLMKYQPIRAFLQRGRYLRWPEDHQDVEWFLNVLSHQILKEKEVKKKPETLELKTVRVT
ncbi:toll-like receptor 5 [Elgaria multicarinata webbii]|uniref:toll-like receptor 5 n=1 Tax=Elgaria multicarinata webbii TaxID=159646 RepID=UPI002FCCE2A1